MEIDMTSTNDDVLAMSVRDLANSKHFGTRAKNVLLIVFDQGILTVQDLIAKGIKHVPNVGNKTIYCMWEVLVEEYKVPQELFSRPAWGFKY
jgi:hypothetical protein